MLEFDADPAVVTARVAAWMRDGHVAPIPGPTGQVVINFGCLPVVETHEVRADVRERRPVVRLKLD